MRQISLMGMLELTACCGFLFAVIPSGDLVAYGIAMGVVSIWSLRISRWTIRWMMFNWLIAATSIVVGLACINQMLSLPDATSESARFWLYTGCALLLWAPLAAVNGFLFMGEFLSWPNRHHRRLRRKPAT